MADVSEDPQDRARMRALDRDIADNKHLLEQQIKQAEKEAAARKSDAADRRTENKRIAEEGRRRINLGPGPDSKGDPATRTANIEREAGARQRLSRQLVTENAARVQALRSAHLQEAQARRLSAETERQRRLPVVYEQRSQLEGVSGVVGRASPAQQIQHSAARIREAVRLEQEALRERGRALAREAATFEQTQRRLLGPGPAGPRALSAGPGPSSLLDAARRAANFSVRETQRLLNAGPQVVTPPQHARYAGFGGGPPPPPPRPPGIPTQGSFDDDDSARKAQRLAAEQERLLQGSLSAARGQGALAGSLERSALALGQSDNAYRRHGALTTEFINAAARGQTTFRELGYQVGTTIGKFAGWTAAAASVYGVLGAVQALGRGALDSASGVGLLDRVVTKDLAGKRIEPGQPSSPEGQGALQRRFRDLSDKFNLPLADVTQAAYGSAKAFSGDLPQALQATEQALFAVKVGELSTSEATLALNAIVKGFGLTAEELPIIFDTINQAQNRFGGNVGNLVKGVAKAGGAFKNAGGTYRELVAILAQGSRLTGAPETEVATAIQRASSTTQTPQGRKRLEAVGIDAGDKTFPELLAEASRKAQGGTPQEVNQIARALIPAGGQFARIFVPLLQNRKLYNQIFRELSQDKAQGSAGRELAAALRQPNEQIKQLGTNLEQLGSALAQAGALNLFVGLVKGLNAGLDVATALLDVINQVGDEIRGIPLVGEAFHGLAVPLAQLGLIVRLLRRFDAGASLPAGRLADSLRRPEGAAFGARLGQGINDQRTFLEEERRKAAQGAARATFLAERTRQESAAAGARVTAPLGTVERDAQEEDARQAQKRHERASATAVRLERDQVYAAEQINDLSRRELEYKRLRRQGLSHRVAAERAGFEYVNASLDRPYPGQPTRIGPAVVPRITPPETLNDEARVAAIAQRDREQAEARRRTPRYESPAQPPPPSTTRYYGRTPGTNIPVFGAQSAAQAEARARTAAQFAQREAQRLGRLAPQTGRTMAALTNATGLLGVAGRGVGVGARGAQGAFRAAASGLRAAASGLSTVARSLGPLDVAIIGALVGYQVYQSGQRSERSARAALARIRQGGQTPGALRAQAEAAKREREKLEDSGSPLNPLSAFHNLGPRLHDVPHDLTFGLIGSSSKELQRQAEDEARQRARTLERAQARGSQLPLGRVRSNFQRRIAAADNDREIEAALNRGRRELAHSYAQTKGGPDAKAGAKRVLQYFQAQIAALKVAQNDLAAAGRAIKDVPTLEAFGERQTLELAQKGPTRPYFRAAGVSVATGRSLARKDPSQAQAALDAARKAQDDAAQAAEAELQRSLAVARSPRQTRVARTTYGRNLKTIFTGEIRRRLRAVNANIRVTEAQIDAAEAALEAAKAAGGDFAPGRAIAKRQADLKKLRAKIAELRGRKGALAADLRLQEAQLSALEAANEQAKNDDANALFDARTQATASGIRDPGKRAAYEAGRAQKNLGRIAKQEGKNSVAYLNAVAEANNAGQQAQEAVVDNFAAQLEANRSAANIGATEDAKLQGAVSDAQALLGHLQAKGADKGEILSAQAALNNARGALVDYMRQQAEDMAAARTEYQLSLTEDPIKKARIEYRGAQDQVKFARTPADRLRAEANVNNKRRDLQSTVYGERVADIDLDLDLEKIDASTAIQRYEQLLKTIKGNKQLKNDLRRKIHQLKKDLEGDFGDLNLDNIRLPTTYEIRRAVSGGQQGISVTNQYRTEINAYDTQAALKVGEQMERYHEGAGRATARAVGQR